MRNLKSSFSKFVLSVMVVGVVMGNVKVGDIQDSIARVLGVKDSVVELVVVGDVMLGRSVNTTMYKKNDFSYPFLEVFSELSKADVVFGNLESPFVSNCRRVDIGMRFCSDKKAIEGLVLAGFDVMSLANNHIFNYGKEGYGETKKVLSDVGIRGVGEGEIKEIKVNGLRLSFLAFEDLVDPISVSKMVKLIEFADKEFDVVIVSFHWGSEYKDAPSLRQKTLARSGVDAGADLIVGHHPHWVQPVEEYKDSLILYSLGNFVFDQMWSEETRKGEVGVINLSRDGVVDYEMKKIKIFDYSQPRWEG